MSLSAIILAAGKATRMKSDRVKVMHPICGIPMLSYVIEACRGVGAGRIYLAVGHDQERVRAAYGDAGDIVFVEQKDQKGTGHAVMECRRTMEKKGDIGEQDNVIVLGGDGPLIRTQTLQALLEKHASEQAAVTLATSKVENPQGYGRIVRDEQGHLVGIVEQSDATPEQQKIREINPTYWMFRTRDMFEALDQVQPNNKKGEYYLTDTLGILKAMGKKLEAVASVPPEDVFSINTRAELALVQGLMQARIQKMHMENGVTLVSPGQTWIEFGVRIGQDATLEPMTWIGAGAVIGPGVHVKAGTVLPPGAQLI